MTLRHGRATWHAILGLALILSGLASLGATRPAFATSTTVVISEFRTRGPSGGNDEFVELYNLSSSPVNIGGWKINASNAAGTTGTRVTIASGVSLGAGCRYLVTNSTAPGYSGGVAGNQLYGTGITDDGGVALLNASNTIIDMAGMSSGSTYKEGTTLAPTTTNANQSYERKPAGQNTQDSDNNADDFALNSGSSNPQNLASPCTPTATTPTVSISATDAGAGEASGDTGTFRITRTGDLSSSLSVSYSVAGSASADDYTPTLTGSAEILSNQSFADIVVDPVDDLVSEGDETVTLTLADGADYDLGDPSSATVTIADNDAPDAAPDVQSTVPADGATNVPLNQNITVTFSEPVNVVDPWFSLSCATSGAHPAAVSGGPSSFILDPASDFVYGEQCTLLIDSTKVSDQDGNDPPDLMALDFTVGFTAQDDPCTLGYTSIPSIQGSGPNAAITGALTTQGVVVGDFGGGTSVGLQGFYLQDPAGDGDPATSDGIFVFTGNSDLVSAGQLVRVTGFARERFNQTAINGADSNAAAVTAANIVVCGSGSVAPTDVSLPFVSATAPERYEGMLVRLPQALQITEYFNFDQFGEVVLGLPLDGEPRAFTPTAIEEPGPAALARAAANSLRRITLDDGRGSQNPDPARHPNGAAFNLTNRFRGGDLLQNTVGVLGFDFSLYRIQPTGPADYIPANPRPTAPEEVGGSLKISGMNTLNFFVTLDYPTGDARDNKCGPANNQECRGADSNQPDEFSRQRAKLLAAIEGLGSDVFGMNELENSAGVEPLQDIVDGLNADLGAGTYAYISTGTIGTDAIKVGLIYKPGKVTPVGSYAILNSSVDPAFIDTKSRPVLAQTFEENATGARFTVAVAHLKSKGSDCNDVGDPDAGDGAGNCNQTRRSAANALVKWLATDPTGSGDPDYLIVGDLNSYAKEDPIDEILAGPDDLLGTADDYTNLIAQYRGPFAYSYTFDGQVGYLDHALASASLTPQVTGAAEWHINADEPDLFDYDTSFKQAAQDALYEPFAYRTSDHDPTQVGLSPNAAPTVDAGGPYTVAEGGSVTLTAAGGDPNADDTLSYAWDFDGDSEFDDATGASPSFSAADLDGPTSATARVRVTDGLGLSATAEATVAVTNVAPTVAAAFGAASAGCGVAAALSGSIDDPGAADTHTASISWGDGSAPESVAVTGRAFSASHAYAAAGTYTATVTATDDDGGVGTTTATFAVNYTAVGGGVLLPINQDGSSVFLYGSTIPVRVRLADCNGSFPEDLAPTIDVTLVSGDRPGGRVNELPLILRPDTGGVMRSIGRQYLYNLGTRSLPDRTATYLITITVPATGQTITAQFGLK